MRKVFYIFSISIIAVIYFLVFPTTKSSLAANNTAADSPYAIGGYFINYLAWAIENGIYPTEEEAISAVQIMAQSTKEAGGAWIREEIPWNFLEPYQGNWNFRLVDIVMQILTAPIKLFIGKSAEK